MVIYVRRRKQNFPLGNLVILSGPNEFVSVCVLRTTQSPQIDGQKIHISEWDVCVCINLSRGRYSTANVDLLMLNSLRKCAHTLKNATISHITLFIFFYTMKKTHCCVCMCVSECVRTKRLSDIFITDWSGAKITAATAATIAQLATRQQK